MKKFVGVALLLLVVSGCGEKKEDVSEEIEKERIQTAEDIAYGVKKSAQLYYTESLIYSPSGFADITFTCSEKNGCVSGNEKLIIDGTVPTAGTITIAADGKITTKGIVINGYNCNIPSEGSATCKK